MSGSNVLIALILSNHPRSYDKENNVSDRALAIT
jgi:hypothetical protein